MIDWAIEAWNDYGKNLRECLASEETIKTTENVDSGEYIVGMVDCGEYIEGVGYQYDEYTKLAELVINHVLNKRLAYQRQRIDTSYLKRLQTGTYWGEIHLIMPLYAGLEYDGQIDVFDYYYTTVGYGSGSTWDAMECALSSYGNDRTNALMRIALTMVQNLRRMGDE